MMLGLLFFCADTHKEECDAGNDQAGSAKGASGIAQGQDHLQAGGDRRRQLPAGDGQQRDHLAQQHGPHGDDGGQPVQRLGRRPQPHHRGHSHRQVRGGVVRRPDVPRPREDRGRRIEPSSATRAPGTLSRGSNFFTKNYTICSHFIFCNISRIPVCLR